MTSLETSEHVRKQERIGWAIGCVVAVFLGIVLGIAREIKPMSFWIAHETVGDMRVISQYVEAYRTAHGTYPVGNIDDLERVVTPHHLLPTRGSWGKYVYIVSADRRHYRIVCGGRDKQIERRFLTITATVPVTETTTDWSDDIVFQDGKLIRIHKELARELHQNSR
jgi:hypothetical protein